MRAIVDKDLCIACGTCEETCPEVFRVEGDVAVALSDPVPEDLADCCRQGAESCPTLAISTEELE